MRPQISDLVALLLGNRRCHENQSVPHSLVVVVMLASEYEVDVTTDNAVMAIYVYTLHAHVT